MMPVQDVLAWSRSATDATSQLRRPRDEPVANGVLNRTVKVVVGVPCAGVTATGVRTPNPPVACAAVAAPARARATTRTAIASRLITRPSVGPRPGRSELHLGTSRDD